MAEITCAVCGVVDTVPFEPKTDHVFCRRCQALYREVQKDKRARVPRKKHGTRVSFPIECSQCGARETLSYMPRGIPLTELLCTSCLQTRLGDESKWHQTHQEVSRETTHARSFEVACGECGVTVHLSRKPKPGRDVFCTSCHNDHVQPEQDPREGAQSLGGDVFIRRGRKKPRRAPEADVFQSLDAEE